VSNENICMDDAHGITFVSTHFKHALHNVSVKGKGGGLG
jgi:hypothetical protein